ncbi:MAG TPA: hypothetical protein VFQ76_15885, partial [Longimicrobiaceae bacterium]|nr:hypothetical protein [Longimicrobiaceae bacterium]
YRYHDAWRAARDADKHDRVLRLARRLPRWREVVAADLDRPGLGRERVLGAALRMLDLAVLRVGNDQYAPGGSAAVASASGSHGSGGSNGSSDSSGGSGGSGSGGTGSESGSGSGSASAGEEDEGSFGLATLRVGHVRIRRGRVRVEYPAKGGIEHAVEFDDPQLHRVVVALCRGRDPEDDLLAYRTGPRGRGGDRHDVRAEDINARVKELAGEEFTAKDLRTWSATVLAAAALAGAARTDTERDRTRAVTAAMREVAEHLGNTPAVARASYVDPRVIECFERGTTIAAAVRRAGSDDLSDAAVRPLLERAVLRMLRATR